MIALRFPSEFFVNGIRRDIISNTRWGLSRRTVPIEYGVAEIRDPKILRKMDMILKHILVR